MLITNWWEVTLGALQNLWIGFLDFVPRFVGAIIVFLIGWAIAVGVAKLVAEILKRIKFNKLFEKGSWKTALEKAEIKVDAAGFVGALFKWILIIVFLSAAVEILGLSQFAGFINSVLVYLPNVVVAVLILVVAAIIADISEKVLRAAVEGIRVGYGELSGAIARWSIWIFAILAILYQLKIAPALIQTLFSGIVALLVVAGGLAFGLGGKDAAADVVAGLRRRFKK